VSSCDNTAELFTLLERLPPGTLDVAVGGHTHRFIAHWVHGVATIESGSHARRLGRIDTCVDADGVGLDRERTTIHPPQELCMEVWKEGGCRPRETSAGTEPATYFGKPIEPMPEVLAALQPYIAKLGEMKEQKLGVRLPKPLRRDEELGPLVAEALARHAQTKLALENIGGVRDDLPGGDLTFGQVYRVLPFGNRVSVMQLTGAQLKSAVRVLYDKRRAPPYLYGLSFVRHEDGTIDLLLAGTNVAVKDEEVYEIATNDFLAKGGDGIDVAISAVTDAQRRFLELSDRDAFIQLLKERFPAK
jgi:5'-nucleotidase